MGVAWKLRKAVRKIRLPCGSFSGTHADVVVDDDDYHNPVSHKNIWNSTVVSANQETIAAALGEETQSSGAIKNLCAICLEPLSYSTGSSPGQAIFTAQCSHAFHFTCISSNVRHGSVTCPICRAHWSQLPRTLYTHSSSSSSSSSCQQLLPNNCNNNQIQTDDPILRILDESIATFRVHRRSSLRSARYDDDDPIEPDHTTPNHPRLHLTLVPCTAVPLGCHGHPNFPPPCSHPSLQAMGGGPTTSYHHHSCELSTPPHHHYTTSSSYSLSPENTSPTTRNSPYHHHHHHHLCFPNTSSRAYLSVKLAHQQATDIVLVASPNGPHLRLLKQSMALVVFSLRSVDRLAIVTYSSAATRAFPLRRMTSHGKRTALQVIDRLFYMGEADPAAGLKKGIKILEDRIHRNPQSCILHLSDSPTRSYVDHDMGVPIPIHRFHVGFGFGTSYGFVMHEFEEFLTRLLGGVIRDTQLMIGEDGGIARLGELRGGEERRIPLELDESGFVRVGYSYIEGGVEEYIRTGEIVVSLGEKREVGDGGEAERRDMSVIAARPSSAESWNYHDPYMTRRWAKHLHGQRL
ncbi:zinc finger protein [Macleaya cordata]|uniref:Zinc finger protein n=1 Tax=Macleaya cordata TaxID=56857 RepID=A0A200RAF3_MACCD|nr:zinc finger protein [Macleaya cordata]